MTGYIKINATTRNGQEVLEVQTHVQNVSFLDRIQVLDALCRSLEIDLPELKLFAALKSKGILDEAIEVQNLKNEHVKGPGEDLLEQLLNAMMGGDDR